VTAIRKFYPILGIAILALGLLAVHSTRTVVAVPTTVVTVNLDSHFVISSTAEDTYGPWKIMGHEKSGVMQSLEVQAFGHDMSVPQAQIARLQHMHIRGTTNSAEINSKKKGGRAICLTLEFEETFRRLKFSFNEDGKIAVEEF
jgi:hypothetical protein